MAKLTLHIGTTKTGTTSIQTNFAHNDALLAERGLVYPKTGRIGGAHHNLAYAASEKPIFLSRHKPSRGGWDEALAEIGGRDGFISTEAFSYLEQGGVLRLAERLKDYDVRIVIYFRDTDSWLHSRMKQKAKFGRTPLDPVAFLGLEEAETLIGLSSSKLSIWKHWAKAFGKERITSIPFHREVIGPDVTRYMLALLGQPEDLFPTVVRRNESQTLKSLVAVQLLARQCRAVLGPDYTLGKNVAAKLSAYFRDRPDVVENYSLFSVEHGQALMDKHGPGTAELAERVGDPRLHVTVARGVAYDHYIPDPMAMVEKFSDEERAFIDTLTQAVLRFNRE